MEFTEAELAAFKSEYAKGATDAQFDLFISECKARNLRPGVHLVFQLRNAKEYDPTLNASVFVKKAYWITTVSALRLIAQRTGEYLGQAPDEFVYLDADGLPTIKSEIPLPTSKTNPLPREPWVARAKVYRKGFIEPMVGMARFEAYAATRKDGTQLVLTDMWAKRGSEQLQKCAEALALRKAYPEELGNLFIAEELRNEEEEKPTAVTPASVVPLPPTAPPVNQVPATPTDAPRPNEERRLGPNPEQDKALEKERSEAFTEIVRAAKTSEDYQKIGTALEIKFDQGGPPNIKEPAAKEKALAAVPELKPAAELPAPEKKKRGPKPKESPVNGRDISSEGGITDADIPTGPTPEAVDEKPAAEAFVEALDPAPTKEEMTGFTARVRALTAKGIKSDYIKSRVLAVGGVEDTKQVTVRAWKQALEELEDAD